MGLSLGWRQIPVEVGRASRATARATVQVDKEYERLRRLDVEVDDPAVPDPRVIALEQRYEAAWEAFERANRSGFLMGAGRMGACLAVMLHVGMVVNVSRPIAPIRAAYPRRDRLRGGSGCLPARPVRRRGDPRAQVL